VNDTFSAAAIAEIKADIRAALQRQAEKQRLREQQFRRPGVRNTLRGTGHAPRLVVSNTSAPLVYPRVASRKQELLARRYRQRTRLGSVA
jgi:hypothetical protein